MRVHSRDTGTTTRRAWSSYARYCPGSESVSRASSSHSGRSAPSTAGVGAGTSVAIGIVPVTVTSLERGSIALVSPSARLHAPLRATRPPRHSVRGGSKSTSPGCCAEALEAGAEPLSAGQAHAPGRSGADPGEAPAMPVLVRPAAPLLDVLLLRRSVGALAARRV